MKKKLLTLLALLTTIVSGAWATDTVIYSWEGGSSGATETGGTIAYTAGTGSNTDQFNIAQSTIAGTIYAIVLQSKNDAATGHTSISLNSALQEGDQIKITGFQNKNATDKQVNLKLVFYEDETSKGTISEGNDPNWVNLYNDANYANADEPETKTFTVTSSLAGSNVLILARNKSGTNLFISKIEIVRPSSKVATPTVTLGDYDVVAGKYAVTLGCTTDGATIYYSTDNKTSYSDYSTALALAPGTTLDAYATKTGMDNSDAMEQYTVPAAPTEWVLTFANAEGATGIVPAVINVDLGGSYTLPKNFTMYKEGYTLTGWNDGTTTYAAGASYTPAGNRTLTAVYTANTVALEDRTGAVTIKWGPFNPDLGIPEIHFEGNTGFVVAQATVASSSIDVKLPIDATSGKFQNQAGNNWTQVGPGTIFTIPAANGATITYKQYDNGTITTPEVNATGDTYELTASGTAGQLYYEYIQVELPALPIEGDVTFDLKNSSFVVSGEGTTSQNINIKSTGSPTSSYLNFSSSDGGGTITITANSPKRIKKIVLTFTGSGNDRTGQMTASTGNYSVSDKTGTWTASEGSNEASVVFTTHNKARVETIVVTYVECESLALSSYEWTTFVSDKALDFTGSDVKAYVVTGHDGTALVKSQVTTVAANTPLLLNADEGSYYIPLASIGTDYTATNKLVAGTGVEISAESGKTRYVLSLNGSSLSFMKIVSVPATVPVGKAYLEFDGEILAPTFGFGDATNINTIANSQEPSANGHYYNLNGQRVAQPTKGLYIVNGRKVVIK